MVRAADSALWIGARNAGNSASRFSIHVSASATVLPSRTNSANASQMRLTITSSLDVMAPTFAELPECEWLAMDKTSGADGCFDRELPSGELASGELAFPRDDASSIEDLSRGNIGLVIIPGHLS
jgi:hypothetical protein